MSGKKGQGSGYSEELAASICAQVSGGLTIKEICLLDDMPGRTAVYKWLGEHEDFANMYARAREERAELVADEIIAIADDGGLDPNDKRVRIDARKWWAAKVNPKKFGDKVTNEHSGPDGGPIPVARIERVIIDPKNPDGEGVPPASG